MEALEGVGQTETEWSTSGVDERSFLEAVRAGMGRALVGYALLEMCHSVDMA